MGADRNFAPPHGYMPDGNPEGRPRIVHAQCLPPMNDVIQTCWVNVEGVAGIYRSEPDAENWVFVPIDGYTGALAFFEFSLNGDTAIAVPVDAFDGILRIENGKASIGDPENVGLSDIITYLIPKRV